METFRTVNGKAYSISTYKGSKGLLTTTYQGGELENGNFSFMMFGDDKRGALISEKARATAAAIEDQHKRALNLFAQEIGEDDTETGAEVYKVEVGQILFLNGYGQNEHGHERKAVYEINGNTYKTVNLEKLIFEQHSHVRNVKELFGIGVYYKEGDKISIEELNKAVEAAKVKKANTDKEREEKSQQAAAQRAADIAKGAELVKVPSNAKAVIVAEVRKNTSRLEEDYHGHQVTETIFLAFSTHDRDLFSEMRKAAKNSPLTAELENAPESWEHREKYSMGEGYYLGERSHSGIVIKKQSWKYTNEHRTKETFEEMQIAAAQGRYFCDSAPEAEAAQAPEAMPRKEEIEAGKIRVIQYSEKAIAVIGDTRPIKDKLKELGGRFNFRLTCGAGWIFPMSKAEELKAALTA